MEGGSDYDDDDGVDSDTDPDAPRLKAVSCRWWPVRGACSLRAFVLHHWAPHDRDLWLCARTDPVWVFFQLLCLCPLFGIRAGFCTFFPASSIRTPTSGSPVLMAASISDKHEFVSRFA